MTTNEVDFILRNSKNGNEYCFTVGKNAQISLVGSNNKNIASLYSNDGVRSLRIGENEFYKDRQVGRCTIDAESYTVLTKIIGDNKLTENDLPKIKNLEGKYGIKKVTLSDKNYGNATIEMDNGKIWYIDLETEFESKNKNNEQLTTTDKEEGILTKFTQFVKNHIKL